MSRLFESTVKNNRVDDITTVITTLTSECKMFLETVTTKRPVSWIYSGRKHTEYWFLGTIRQDREPRDLHLEIHNDIDKLFKEKFGYPPRRSSIFVTGSNSSSSQYGDPYMIFPKGAFKYLWNPDIRDLYVKIRTQTDKAKVRKDTRNPLYAYFLQYSENDFGRGTPYKEIVEFAKEQYFWFLGEIVKGYKKTDLIQAIQGRGEIMITGNKYYAVSERYETMITKYFSEFGTIKKSSSEVREWVVKNDRF